MNGLGDSQGGGSGPTGGEWTVDGGLGASPFIVGWREKKEGKGKGKGKGN